MERTSEITRKQLNEAYVKALDALRAWRSPCMVQPDVWLCAEGRVHRAFAIANTKPVEEHEKYRVAIDKLIEDALKRQKLYEVQMRAYEELCKAAGVEPSKVEIKKCACEGCKLVEESIWA